MSGYSLGQQKRRSDQTKQDLRCQLAEYCDMYMPVGYQADSKSLDQPAYLYSLLWAFAVRFQNILMLRILTSSTK